MFWYCEDVQTVNIAHWRSVVSVGAADSYWELASHELKLLHILSAAAVGASDWYCSAVQTVKAEQVRSEVRVWGLDMYSSAVQVFTAAHCRSVVLVGAAV